MKYFGTDGIRRDSGFFTKEFLQKVCRAIVYTKKAPVVVIAKDPRKSGLLIEGMLAAELARLGGRVVLLGMTPTPVLAYCIKAYKADFGIMISASHNPPQYNGIKILDSEGRKITQQLECELEAVIDADLQPVQDKSGVILGEDGEAEYLKQFISLLKPRICPKHILLDTANGATAFVAKRLFEGLDCKVDVIFCDTEGDNINVGCGAASPQAFIQKMQGGGYDAGFSFDGDGDRVLAYYKDRIIDGDHIINILAKYMLQQGELKNKTIIGTIMSNCAVQETAAKNGFDFIRTAVGDKYVAEEMKKTGAELGGEASGHIIIGKYQNTGDGLLAAAMLIAAECSKGIDYYDDIKDYPQINGDILTTQDGIARYKASQEKIEKEVDKVRQLFDGRLVVRTSGTEPKIRIMAEAKTEPQACAAVARVRLMITKELGL